MTKARNVKRGDALSLMVPNMRVLSTKRLADGLVAIKVEAEDSPSMQFGDGGCVLEIICKGGRRLSSYPWRPDDKGGGGGGDDPDPIAPSDPELGLKLKERA